MLGSHLHMKNETSQVVFFLGAGASVRAGVPDTFRFVDEFVSSLSGLPEQQTVLKIIDKLKEWRNGRIDIELLLETLTKLKNKDAEPLLLFYENKKFLLEGELEKQPIIKRLKDFIKSKAIVSEEKIDYLQPLLGFVEEYRPLDIISLNYDTCIEQLSRINKLACQDGFESEWKPSVFDSESSDVRLYKVHGSILWYETDNANYIKVPVLSEASEIQLATGETAQNLMLYPMQKIGYAEPLLELLVRTKKLLESKTCEFMIVAGYSFRDDHIVKIVLDSARKNRNLHIILIGPDAYRIYHERLKYYNHSRAVSSSLDGRVSCLPYKFEAVLPELKDEYVKKLREGISAEKGLLSRERKGEYVDWGETLALYAEAENFEKVDVLLRKVSSETLRKHWDMALWIYMTAHINLFAGGDARNVTYLAKFKKLLTELLVSNFDLWLNEEPYVGNEIRFKTGAGAQGNPIAPVSFVDFRSSIAELGRWINKRRAHGSSEFSSQIDSLRDNLKAVYDHLAEYGNGVVNFDAYIEKKSENASPECKELYLRYRQGEFRNLLPVIKRIEQMRNEKIVSAFL